MQVLGVHARAPVRPRASCRRRSPPCCARPERSCRRRPRGGRSARSCRAARPPAPSRRRAAAGAGLRARAGRAPPPTRPRPCSSARSARPAGRWSSRAPARTPCPGAFSSNRSTRRRPMKPGRACHEVGHRSQSLSRKTLGRPAEPGSGQPSGARLRFATPPRPLLRAPRRRRIARRPARRPRTPPVRRSASSASPSCSVIPRPSIAARRSASIVRWGKRASPSASASARSRCAPGGTTSVSRPIDSASLRVDHAAGEDHVERAAEADDAGQALGAAVDQRHAPAALRVAERGALGGDAQVAPQRQLQAAREAEAGDRGDRRLGRRQAREAHRPLLAHQPSGHRVGRLQVGAGAEGDTAGAGQHEHARVRRQPRSAGRPRAARPRWGRRRRCAGAGGRS